MSHAGLISYLFRGKVSAVSTVPTLPKWKVIGFTGHRDLKHPHIVSTSLCQLWSALNYVHPALVAIGSAASGSDTLFAQAAVSLGVPLALILPFSKERFQQDFSDPDDWKRTDFLLKVAMSVDIIDAQATDNEAYMEAGIVTVDHADIVIAVWDGQPSKGRGGTADVVDYAKALKKRVIVVDPESGYFDEKQLLNVIHSIQTNPTNISEMAYAKEDSRNYVKEWFNAKDEVAKQHGPKTRRLVAFYLLGHLIASGLVIAKLSFHECPEWMKALISVLELVFLVCVGFLLLKKHKVSRQKWLETRVDAEIGRSFLATWDIRRHEVYHRVPKPPFTGYDETFKSLRILRNLDRSDMPDTVTVRNRYALERVRDQHKYFRKQRRSGAAKSTFYKKFARVLTGTAIFVALITACFSAYQAWEQFNGHRVEAIAASQPANRSREASELRVTERETWSIEVLELLAGLIPLGAAAIGSVMLAREYHRRAELYEDIEKVMREQFRCLKAQTTWDGISRVARRVEAVLLDEVAEWKSYARFAGDLH